MRIFGYLLAFWLCCMPAYAETAAQERDTLFMLAAYSSLLTDWQDFSLKTPKRGSNVATLFVKDGTIVASGMNRIFAQKSMLHHAEMETVLQYLKHSHSKQAADLTGVSVYTTLEPCLMCYGTLHTLHAARIVYGQHYPRGVESIELNGKDSLLEVMPSALDTLQLLDAAFQQSNKTMEAWLGSKEAKVIFKQAFCKLKNFTPSHPENERTLKAIQDFLPPISVICAKPPNH